MRRLLFVSLVLMLAGCSGGFTGVAQESCAVARKICRLAEGACSAIDSPDAGH